MLLSNEVFGRLSLLVTLGLSRLLSCALKIWLRAVPVIVSIYGEPLGEAMALLFGLLPLVVIIGSMLVVCVVRSVWAESRVLSWILV